MLLTNPTEAEVAKARIWRRLHHAGHPAAYPALPPYLESPGDCATDTLSPWLKRQRG